MGAREPGGRFGAGHGLRGRGDGEGVNRQASLFHSPPPWRDTRTACVGPWEGGWAWVVADGVAPGWGWEPTSGRACGRLDRARSGIPAVSVSADFPSLAWWVDYRLAFVAETSLQDASKSRKIE